jgi:chromosomal replication initiation ATPase DnaA
VSDRLQFTLEFEHRPALGGEDFLVADCNREAVGWLDRWPDWPAPALVLHGPAGCGKTHLAQVFMGRSGARPVAPAELLSLEPPALIGESRNCVIEDLDAAFSTDLERPLFHLHNGLRDAGGNLLITARQAPSFWNIGLPDLRSRLLAAPAAAIGLPDDALLAAVVVKLFADRQLRVDADVVPFLVARIDRSFESARFWVAELDRAALAARRSITVPFVRRVLASSKETRDPTEPGMA